MIVDISSCFTSTISGPDGLESLEKHWMYSKDLPCLQLPKLKIKMPCDACGKPIKRWPIIVVLWKMKPYFVHETGGCFDRFLHNRYDIEKACGHRDTYEHENKLGDT